MIIRILLFFLVLLLNSFYGAVLMAVPAADRLFRLAMFACDGIMIVMAVSVVWRNRMFAGVRYLLLFLFVSTLTFFYNVHVIGIATHLNGLRQPLFLLSTLIVLHDFSQSRRWPEFERLVNAFLLIFAIAQIPLSVYQFAIWGAGDYVGGTYGYTGGSGFVSQLAFLIAFYFIARASWDRDPDNVRIRSVFLYSLLLIPCMINETKISFVFLAAYIVLFTMSRSKILKSIPILAFGIALVLVLNYYYGKTVEDPTNVFDEKFLERYLMYDPRENVDVPRFQKLVLMFRVMHGDPIAILIGLGYGIFAGENILGVTSFSRTLWYFSGTRIQLQTTWIQGGLISVFLLLPASFWFLKRRRLLVSGNMRRFHTYLAFMIAICWLYNEALYSRPFIMIASYMIIWIGMGGMDKQAEDQTPQPALTEAQPAIQPGTQ